MTQFQHEVILDLLKICFQGLVLLTALAISAQLYFRRAIKHEARKAAVRQKVASTVTEVRRSGNERLLVRFEKDSVNLRRELEATRAALAHSVKSETELARENRYLTAEIEEMRKVQTQFIELMGKFIAGLKARGLQEEPIKGSGGLSRVSEGEDPTETG